MKQAIQGFTLIELLVTVAIIALLSAIAIPAYQHYITRAQAQSALASLSALQVAIEDYVLFEGSFPADFAAITASASQNASPTSPTGTLALSTSSDSASAGSLILTLGGEDGSVRINSALRGDRLALVRSADGIWHCQYTLVEGHDAIVSLLPDCSASSG